MKKREIRILTAGLALATACCGPAELGGTENAPPVTSTYAPVATPSAATPWLATDTRAPPMPGGIDEKATNTTPAAPPSGRFSELVSLAREDLARRLSFSVDAIEVVSVIGQDFTPQAFYCRATKERIAREETLPTLSGASIVLGAGARRYEYHASGSVVVFCRSLPS